ncbi:Na/Pi cotransporter family protein [Simiduia curdlanivorans]|uniref:Na/Pi cotransporter family protein n=1 Tax=Simiduia curdlanivorans TaxID=1492769 RepID=A0ABV8V7E2_9GAMM|nr:Na/Pi cotransporter family protein [Simiduia curdlanivorans]MDN3638696.1 Na/Pi cotransporter family protein [Simiduia curdlanivorans]
MLNLFGSLGFFLLGMWLMTEGLKLAGGRALEHLLGRWTSSKIRGLLSGIGITALVQSSSAVTVAVIGFVNAGLMSFHQAMWVVFGSNVGTTFTAWIVTLFGFSFKIDAFAFPLIGIGALLRLFAPHERGRAFGMAIAGFGLLFLGIDFLQVNFSSLAQTLNIQEIFSHANSPALIALILGIVLTIVTQSSSAAIAIILTAVASGILSLEVAAATVIGANVGTTSTAILATLGATPNAKRLAAAHVAFNLLTAAVALVFLPIFWWLVTQASNATGLTQTPILLLAIFHTAFNLLGLLLIWPIENNLSNWLLNHFREPNDFTKSPHLDTNVAAIPDLAVRAVALEIVELLTISKRFLAATETAKTVQDIKHVESRVRQMNVFISTALKSELAQSQGELLAAGLSAGHHLNYGCRAMLDIIEQKLAIKNMGVQEMESLDRWQTQIQHWLASTTALSDHASSIEFSKIKSDYKELKQELILSAAKSHRPIELVDAALTETSYIRRFAEQLIQVSAALEKLQAHNKSHQDNKPEFDSTISL